MNANEKALPRHHQWARGTEQVGTGHTRAADNIPYPHNPARQCHSTLALQLRGLFIPFALLPEIGRMLRDITFVGAKNRYYAQSMPMMPAKKMTWKHLGRILL